MGGCVSEVVVSTNELARLQRQLALERGPVLKRSVSTSPKIQPTLPVEPNVKCSGKERRAKDFGSSSFKRVRLTESRAEMQQKELEKQDVLREISQMYLNMEREMPAEFAEYKIGFLRAHLANIRRDARRRSRLWTP
jgi:hypothetical protein